MPEQEQEQQHQQDSGSSRSTAVAEQQEQQPAQPVTGATVESSAPEQQEQQPDPILRLYGKEGTTGLAVLGNIREVRWIIPKDTPPEQQGTAGRLVLYASSKQGLCRLADDGSPIEVSKGKGGKHIWSQSITIDPATSRAVASSKGITISDAHPTPDPAAFARLATSIVAHTRRFGLAGEVHFPLTSTSSKGTSVTYSDADRAAALAAALARRATTTTS